LSFDQQELKSADELESEDREAQAAVCHPNLLAWNCLISYSSETSRTYPKRDTAGSVCGTRVDESHGWSSTSSIIARKLGRPNDEPCQNPDAKPDYRTQSLTELNKLEQKVILLNEMLDNVDSGRRERFAAGDVYDVRPTVHVLLHLPKPWSRYPASCHTTHFRATEASKMDLRCRVG
jgi:hypothetical protein